MASAIDQTTLRTGSGGDVLLLSMRRIADLVAYCIPYEFEDVIVKVCGADRIDLGDEPNLELSRRSYKAIRLATRSRTLAEGFFRRPHQVTLNRDYELFLPVFNDPYELFALNGVANWRERCKVAACYISEVWVQALPGYLMEQLAKFDHVFVGASQAADTVSRVTGRPCTYVPLAADVLTFAPVDSRAPRPIDVLGIGRRSAVTHAALVELARQRKIFYYYDTVASSGLDKRQRTFRVANAAEHRLHLASLLQRSRYFIANRARINEPDLSNGEDETSARFYEGAASGAVMIGEAPRSRQFLEEFDWPDAVIRMPFDSPDIGRILSELDRDPQRLNAIHQRNVHYAAQRHDWSNRLRVIYEKLQLTPTVGMLEREAALAQVASEAQSTERDAAMVA